MNRKELTEIVKEFYNRNHSHYHNRLIICGSVLEAAKVAEYLTKYDVGEIVLNSFKNKNNDKFVAKVLRLHAKINSTKPREEFEEFLALYAKHRFVFGYAHPLDEMFAHPLDEMFAHFDHVSAYEECFIGVLKPQYSYSMWQDDFRKEYYKIHPFN